MVTCRLRLFPSEATAATELWIYSQYTVLTVTTVPIVPKHTDADVELHAFICLALDPAFNQVFVYVNPEVMTGDGVTFIHVLVDTVLE